MDKISEIIEKELCVHVFDQDFASYGGKKVALNVLEQYLSPEGRYRFIVPFASKFGSGDNLPTFGPIILTKVSCAEEPMIRPRHVHIANSVGLTPHQFVGAHLALKESCGQSNLEIVEVMEFSFDGLQPDLMDCKEFFKKALEVTDALGGAIIVDDNL